MEDYNRMVEMIDKGYYSDALNQVNWAISCKRNEGKWYYLRALIHEHEVRQKDAIGDYTLAISKKFDVARSYARRGACWLRLGDLDGAMRDFEQALAHKLEDADVYANMADVKMRRSRWKEAVELCNKALELKPEHVLALTYCGRACLSEKQYLHAMKDLTVAIKLAEKRDDIPLSNKLDALLARAEVADAINVPEQAEEDRRIAWRLKEVEPDQEESALPLARRFAYDGEDRHFNIYTDSRNRRKRFGRFLKHFVEFVDSKLIEVNPEFRVKVFVFGNGILFRNFLKQKLNDHRTIAALWKPRWNSVLLYDEGGVGSAAHEMMHAIIDRHLLFTDHWADEGIPTIFDQVYGFAEKHEAVISMGYQSPRGIRALRRRLKSLDLEKIVARRVSTVNEQHEERMVGLFLVKHEKLKRYLDLCRMGKREGYPTVLEAAFEKPVAELKPLWEAYLHDVFLRKGRIEGIPRSHFFLSQKDYLRFMRRHQNVFKTELTHREHHGRRHRLRKPRGSHHKHAR